MNSTEIVAGPMLDTLRTEIERAVSRYCDVAPHRRAVVEVLKRPGFALHPEARCRAGVLALHVYRAVRGAVDEAGLLAATAVELYQEAAFLFDDVADHEVDPAVGSTDDAELALAISLMSCGLAAGCDAAGRSGAGGSPLLALEELARNCITASSGQYMDASLARLEAATTEEALKMTELKAGGCGRLVTSFAAGLATDDDGLRALFSDLGFNIFVYLQLVDDIRDAFPQAEGGTADMLKGKKTVPLAYFRGPGSDQTEAEADAIMPEVDVSDDDEGEYRRRFDASGANVFGAVVAEAYLNQAKANLAELSDRLGRLDKLERFIESLEFSPREVSAAQ